MIQIRKAGYLNWFHYWDGITPTAKYGASDLVITFDGNIMYLRATNGRVIFLKDGFDYSDVEVYDDTNGQSWTSFASVIELQQKLIDLGHPAYAQQGEIIQPENFTDLADTPSTYVGQASKYTRVKADETGLEFVSGGGGGGGVESVTGDSVDNTDPLNPVVNAIPLSGTEVGGPVTGTITNNDGENDIVTISPGDGDESGAVIIRDNANGVLGEDLTIRPNSITRNKTASNTLVQFDANDIKIIDANGSFKGMSYGSDFSANFDNRSLPDVEWVQKNKHKGISLYNATTTGTVNLDCATFDSWYRILTGNTDFTFSNTPASGETFVKTLEIITTAGETLDFSTADKVTGTFVNDDTTVNIITINFANYPTVGLRVTVMINS